MAKKVAEQLVDTLIEAGVRRIYAVTGDSLNEVNEAVRQNEAMKWIHVRHEETGAYAAGAEAQLTGLPGCCAGSATSSPRRTRGVPNTAPYPPPSPSRSIRFTGRPERPSSRRERAP